MSLEYDRFGPWVCEIKCLDDMPRLFYDYYNLIENALMCVKIPREIERRNANPDMDLYDWVIAAKEDGLCILKRVEHSVEILEIDYKALSAIKNTENLLLGTLTLYISDGRIFSANYNTVSDKLMAELVKLIRSKYVQKEVVSLDQIDEEEIDKESDFLYFNLLQRLRKTEEPFKFIAYQKSARISPVKNSGKISFIRFFVPKTLLSVMILVNEKEAIIVSRGKAFKKPKEARYKHDFTYVPFDRISDILTKEEDYENLSSVNISTPGHTFKFYFEASNPQKNILGSLFSLY